MKLSRILILALVLSATIFSSCKKDEDPGPYVNTVTAKVEGVGFVADSILSISTTPVMSFTSTSGKEKVVLYIPKSTTVGTYALDNINYNIMYFDKNGQIYLSKGGSITVSKYDATTRVIEGTFSQTMFNGASNKSMTDGVFKIMY